MKKNLLILAVLFGSVNLFGNNINVSNISTTGINTSAGTNNVANFKMIKFDITWENSWRMSFGPSNWDAAWVFVKYRVSAANGGDGLWKHAFLNNTGQVVPSGSTIDIGLLNQSSAFNLTTNPGLGVFIYRNADGNGTNNFTNIQLRWNYGATGLSDISPADVQVFAVEMAFVPGGVNFNIGGGGGSNAFTSTNISTGTASSIGTGYPTGGTNTNASFPNGYNQFYCMKYEISNQQITDFLNTLTYTQQTTLTINLPNSAAGTGAYNNTIRNAIDIATPGISTFLPAVYACNLDGDAIMEETNDGLWIACNNLSWSDVAAYLDWSGLRPMTELEFEKACRGTLAPVANEFAWGSTFIALASTISNGGQANETVPSATSNCNYSTALNSHVLRVGIFATSTSTRVQAGATYYGIMEMSGNTNERTVTAGVSPTFNGNNGNGALTSNGDADVSNWPGTSAAGAGFKGGNWNSNGICPPCEISDRSAAATVTSTRSSNNGGRGVRVAP